MVRAVRTGNGAVVRSRRRRGGVTSEAHGRRAGGATKQAGRQFQDRQARNSDDGTSCGAGVTRGFVPGARREKGGTRQPPGTGRTSGDSTEAPEDGFEGRRRGTEASVYTRSRRCSRRRSSRGAGRQQRRREVAGTAVPTARHGCRWPKRNGKQQLKAPPKVRVSLFKGG